MSFFGIGRKKSEAEKAEEKELKWIILEFYKTKLVYKALIDAKENPKESKDKIKKALRLLNKDERTERRLARGFSRMEEALDTDLKKLEKKHFKKLQDSAGQIQEIQKMLKKAEVFNADIEKEDSRGGEVEKLLKASEGDISKLNDTIKEVEKVLKELKGFDVVMHEIIKQTIMIDKEIDIVIRNDNKLNDIKGLVRNSELLAKSIYKQLTESNNSLYALKEKISKLDKSERAEYYELNKKGEELTTTEHERLEKIQENVDHYNDINNSLGNRTFQISKYLKHFEKAKDIGYVEMNEKGEIEIGVGFGQKAKLKEILEREESGFDSTILYYNKYMLDPKDSPVINQYDSEIIKSIELILTEFNKHHDLIKKLIKEL